MRVYAYAHMYDTESRIPWDTHTLMTRSELQSVVGSKCIGANICGLLTSRLLQHHITSKAAFVSPSSGLKRQQSGSNVGICSALVMRGVGPGSLMADPHPRGSRMFTREAGARPSACTTGFPWEWLDSELTGWFLSLHQTRSPLHPCPLGRPPFLCLSTTVCYSRIEFSWIG